MTIVAGFCVREGVLICADTEHSGGVVNVHESKLILSPNMHGSRVMFSYSGNSPLAKGAIRRCIDDLYEQSAGSLSTPASVAYRIEEVLNFQYARHVSPQPDMNASSAYQLMFAVRCPRKNVALYSTWKGAVTASRSYEVIGIGEHIGRYIMGSLLESKLNAEYAYSIACYAIAKAKQLTEGVGGLTHACLLKHDGVTDKMPPARTLMREQAIDAFDYYVRELFSRLISEPDDEFLNCLGGFNESMKQVRSMGMFDDSTRDDLTALVVSVTKRPFPSIQSVPGPAIYDPSGQQP